MKPRHESAKRTAADAIRIPPVKRVTRPRSGRQRMPQNPARETRHESAKRTAAYSLGRKPQVASTNTIEARGGGRQRKGAVLQVLLVTRKSSNFVPGWIHPITMRD